jgi:hypothetical protein
LASHDRFSSRRWRSASTAARMRVSKSGDSGLRLRSAPAMVPPPSPAAHAGRPERAPQAVEHQPHKLAEEVGVGQPAGSMIRSVGPLWDSHPIQGTKRPKVADSARAASEQACAHRRG